MSLGKDLAIVRNKLGLTLEEIQGQIKIPIYVIQSIENDSIFSEIETNKTYTRSFVRSYAKVLKLSDSLIVEALDLIEAGMYAAGTILDDELAKKHSPLIKPDVLDDHSENSKLIFVKPDIEEAPQKPTPTVENVNWADLGRQFNEPTANPKIIFPVVIALVIIGIAIVIYIYREPIFSIFKSSDEPEISEVLESNNQQILTDVVSDSTSLNTTDHAAQDSEPVNNSILQNNDSQVSNSVYTTGFSSVLADTITVTVYAAFNKLEPVRITSDFNWRTNPFWMEQGEAFNFSFVDTLLIRGQYNRMLLLFNGHAIDDPFGNYYDNTFDSIILTRNILSDEQYFVQPPADFPFEIGAPDSLVSPLQN